MAILAILAALSHPQWPQEGYWFHSTSIHPRCDPSRPDLVQGNWSSKQSAQGSQSPCLNFPAGRPRRRPNHRPLATLRWAQTFSPPAVLTAAARPGAPCRWHSAAGRPDFGVSPPVPVEASAASPSPPGPFFVPLRPVVVLPPPAVFGLLAPPRVFYPFPKLPGIPGLVALASSDLQLVAPVGPRSLRGESPFPPCKLLGGLAPLQLQSAREGRR
mmetsp:Transcript_3593/g.7614  ORF Transcript_3593/g.7614 Transcript_3593/m.7614 type:complete len:215 (-) Transcript_3593:8-652(-)